MSMRIKKPIRIFWSPLSRRLYASSQYRDDGKGHAIITGDKYDVTNEIAGLIEEHSIEFVPQAAAIRAELNQENGS